MKVALCIPTRKEPFPQMIEAVDASIASIKAAGHVVGAVTVAGSAYISWAAALMVAKGLLWGADAAILIEDDMSFGPDALLKLIETPGDVVAGNYRYKTELEEYMGFPLLTGDPGGAFDKPELPEGVQSTMLIRKDGCIVGKSAPAGFLKITRECVERFRKAYPETICDDTRQGTEFTDLFQHGGHKGVWYGQDFAFCRRWRDCGETVWIQPDLDISHWLRKDDGTYVEFPGNYRKWLMAKHSVDFDKMQAELAAREVRRSAA
jgi:hypothetical protein